MRECEYCHEATGTVKRRHLREGGHDEYCEIVYLCAECWQDLQMPVGMRRDR